MRSRVTTKQGDTGETRTLAGDLLPKCHIVLECTGGVDALRAHTALVRVMMLDEEPQHFAESAEFLLWLLHAYFLVGAEVNDPECKHPEYRHDTLSERHLERLEAEQQRLEATLTLPRSFIVCASTLAAAQADIAATVARALERNLVRLKAETPSFEADVILKFVNRTSDYLYILARHLENGAHLPVDYSVLERPAE